LKIMSIFLQMACRVCGNTIYVIITYDMQYGNLLFCQLFCCDIHRNFSIFYESIFSAVSNIRYLYAIIPFGQPPNWSKILKDSTIPWLTPNEYPNNTSWSPSRRQITSISGDF
jgi:hypothetical protein